MSAGARLVLASGSQARRQLLASVGLAFDVHPSPIDETVLKQRLRTDGLSASTVATSLAEAKALAVSASRLDEMVIGADQVLTCGDRWYDKPDDLDVARRHLSELRGRSQVLHTACVLALGGEIVWSHMVRPRLVMRRFSDEVRDAYLAHEDVAVCTSVGACRIEGPGYLLFTSIEGEHAAVLGLPLLALAGELRRRGILPT